MNPLPKTESPAGFANAGFRHVTSFFDGAAAQGAKNVEAAAEALVAAAQGAEQLNAHVVSSVTKSFGDAIEAVVALSKARCPQEIWEVQQRFARDAFEAYNSNVLAFVDLVQAGFKASSRPVADRYNEVGSLRA